MNKMNILCFDYEKTLLIIKHFFSLPKYVRYEISVEMQNCLIDQSLRLFFLLEIFGRK